MYESITVSDFYQKQQTEKLLILDVRDKEDFDDEHIATAINIPINELPQRLNELNAESEYYVICYSGMRSTKACDFLDSKHYKVVNVLGGMKVWRFEKLRH